MYSVESAQRIAETHDIKLPTSKGHVSLSPHYRKAKWVQRRKQDWEKGTNGKLRLWVWCNCCRLCISFLCFPTLLSFVVLPPCSSLIVILDRHNAPSCSLQPYIRSVLNRHISPFHLKFFASPASKQRLPSLTMESWHALMYKEKVPWNLEICHLSCWLLQKGWKWTSKGHTAVPEWLTIKKDLDFSRPNI